MELMMTTNFEQMGLGERERGGERGKDRERGRERGGEGGRDKLLFELSKVGAVP